MERALLDFLMGSAAVLAMVLALALFYVLLLVVTKLLAFLLTAGIGLYRMSPFAPVALVFTAVLLAYVLLGAGVALALACALAVPLGTAVAVYRKPQPFFVSVFICSAGVLAGMAGGYAIFGAFAGDPITFLLGELTDVVMTDTMASEIGVRIFAPLGALPADLPQAEGVVAALALLAEELRYLIPSMMLGYAMTSGLFACVFPSAHAARRGKTALDMPPLETWRMPSRLAFGISGMYLVVWVLSLINGEVFFAPHRAMVTVFTFAYAVQGVAAGEHMLKRRGMSRRARAAIELGVFMCFQQAAMVVGLMDWWFPRRPVARQADGGEEADE